MVDPRFVESDAVQQEYYKNVANLSGGSPGKEQIVTSFNPHLPYNKRQEISIKLPQLSLEYSEESHLERFRAHIGSGQITESLSRRSNSHESSLSPDQEAFAALKE